MRPAAANIIHPIGGGDMFHDHAQFLNGSLSRAARVARRTARGWRWPAGRLVLLLLDRAVEVLERAGQAAAGPRATCSR